ncbi:uncharacterized protein PV07_07101 [Cladophialophora immunda]|uniref:Uncharacterized protein n=1 Tax=Cladophialophora immunda TaxID=569365 RepID=A0A0D2AQI1_9EURO|nr:uncharacterized protein PV07_07101 [Cladophialophora immunda]KIW27357.1 hypothetical protein PV07_07101 [Cladophialophora immunda]
MGFVSPRTTTQAMKNNLHSPRRTSRSKKTCFHGASVCGRSAREGSSVLFPRSTSPFACPQLMRTFFTKKSSFQSEPHLSGAQQRGVVVVGVRISIFPGFLHLPWTFRVNQEKMSSGTAFSNES